jgi:predicted small lipoprotein YifL
LVRLGNKDLSQKHTYFKEGIMKQRTMKLTALFACAAMVMGSFAACGNKGGEVDPTPTPTQGAADPTEAPDKNNTYNGTEIKVFGSQWNDVGSDDPVKQEAIKAVEDKWGVKFVKVELASPESSWDDQIITSVANGEPCVDIITLNPECMLSCFMNGVMLDITDYVDDLKIGKIYSEAGTWQGKTYGISFDNLGDSWCLVYDRDYLKQIGMDKTPTEMFMEGKWSYADFEAYCADMKAKLPENVYPIGQYPFHWGVMAAGANGSVVCDMNCHLGLLDDGYLEALTFYADLEKKGLAFPMKQTEADDGTITQDIAYQVSDERIVMKRAEAWELGGISFNFGIAFWPWGSQVTCDGDYKTLSENYKVTCAYWGVDSIVADSCTKLGIPAEDMVQIMYDFRASLRGDNGLKFMHDAYDSEIAGNPMYGESFGKERSFTTDEDIELYDWAHSRFMADMAWPMASAEIFSTWKSTGDVLLRYYDVRSTMESYYNQAKAALEDAGVTLS